MFDAKFHRVARFGIVGLVNAAFGYLAFSALVWAGVADWISVFLANVVGVIFNFFTYGFFVFFGIFRKNFFKFLVVYSVLFLINVCFLRLAGEKLGGVFLAQALVTLPLAGISYLMMSRWVFKSI